MRTQLSIPGKSLSSTWLYRWIYLLAAGFMFSAVALRTLLVGQGSPLLRPAWLLLAAWLLAFLANTLFDGRLPWATAALMGVEGLLVLALLLNTRTDFFAFLFAILSMQAMQQYPPRATAAWIGFFTLLTFLSLYQPYGPFQALALALIFSAVCVFLAAYIGSTRRLSVIQARQQALVSELQAANRQLTYYAQARQQLAANRERQRLARELHDSVTQTIFSMTLATQSALLLLERDRPQVGVQLERLGQLAHSSLAEMQVLISSLAPEPMAGGGFAAAVQQHLANRFRRENLAASLEIEGCQPLEPIEEAGLFRIAQEALNNIVKHAQVDRAEVRLHLCQPFWMEICDQGVGFDPRLAQDGSRVGLASMQERAAEIGWKLQVDSAPGAGTRVRVEKIVEEGKQYEGAS